MKLPAAETLSISLSSICLVGIVAGIAFAAASFADIATAIIASTIADIAAMI